MRRAVAHERQVICSRFTRKLLITKLLERCLLVATGVPYKSQLTLEPMSLTLHAVNGRFVFQSQNGQLLEWP